MKINKAIFSPVLFLLAVVLAVLLVWPETGLILNLKKQVEAKQEELQKKQAYYSNLKLALQELENYKSSTEAISQALPEELSVASLLDYFQKEAAKNGLVLKSVSQNNAADSTLQESAKRMKEAFFVITVSGSVESAEAFLRNLELSSRIIEVEALNLKAQASLQAELPEMSITVKVYHY